MVGTVKTRNGVVTLTGRAPSEVEQYLAESVAKDTMGVKRVNNQLGAEQVDTAHDG